MTYQDIVDRLNNALAPDGRALAEVLHQSAVLIQWRDGIQAYWSKDGLEISRSNRLADAWAAYPRWMEIADMWEVTA